jgi:hypothetical protein
MPWPGLYADAAGRLHAVSLVGLKPGRPPVTPDEAIAAIELPRAEYAERGVPLWPVLAAAAAALWLAGWAVRLR